MIRTLGGPRFSPGDFEWATSLPAGKNLIDWLASQAATEASEGHAGINSTVALHSIALHEAEIKEYVCVLDDAICSQRGYAAQKSQRKQAL